MLVRAEEFDYNIIKALPILARPRGNQRTRRKLTYYKDAVCAFDTETTYIKELDRQVLYIWQFQLDGALTIIGRTWAEFLDFYEKCCAALDEDGTSLCVYVHNLSYEYQFMRSLFHIAPEDVFVVKSRRILKWTCGRFDFRCSYLHTNMSLDAYTKKFDVQHKKLSGAAFDYKKVRYPDTPLSDAELEYCVNDVRGLVEALKAEMQRDGDTLYTIPLTSTGYVRREIRAALSAWGRYNVQNLLPDVDVYKLLREAFRGGNTHANRYFVKNPDWPAPPIRDVHSVDRSSSYPDVQVSYPFPMSPFRRVVKDVPLSRLRDHYIGKRGYALLFRLEINGLKLRDPFNPCPYIPLDKCRDVRRKVMDNGRLLSADHLEITLTDVDFKIIDKQYILTDDNTTVSALYFAQYGPLPETLRELVKHFYIEKTRLKGVKQQKLYYEKFKNLINSIYGCSAQDPGKDHMLYLEDMEDLYQEEGRDLVDILASAHPTMPYQWGVWTTARARECLQIMIDAVHENPGSEFVYTDTDSVKYIGTYDLEKINARLREIAEKSGAKATDPKGTVHYMGCYEDEGTYPRFETLGAKSYVYEDEDGLLHITIAGVPKDEGAAELARAGGFEAYHVGLVFRDGVTETHYNDSREYRTVQVDGHNVELTSDLIIRDSFHQIGFAQDYKILLKTLTKADIDKVRMV